MPDTYKVELGRTKLPNGHRLGHLRLFSDATLARCRSAGSSLALKDLPELQALVGRGSGEKLTIGAETAVQNTGLVSGDLDIADESWVAPDAERVVRETARADDLAVVVAPSQTGDLGAGVDAVGAGTGRGVPEVDVTVVGTTPGGEEVELPGAPTESLDSGAVVGLGELGGT